MTPEDLERLTSPFRARPEADDLDRHDLSAARGVANDAERLLGAFRRTGDRIRVVQADASLSDKGKADQVGAAWTALREQAAKFDGRVMRRFVGSQLEFVARKATPAWPSDAGAAIALARRLDRLAAMPGEKIDELVRARDRETITALAQADAAERREILGRLPRMSSTPDENQVLDAARAMHAPEKAAAVRAAREQVDWAVDVVSKVVAKIEVGEPDDKPFRSHDSQAYLTRARASLLDASKDAEPSP